MMIQEACYYTLVVPYLLFAFAARREITPNSIFLCFQLVMFIGLKSYIDPEYSPDNVYLWIYFITALMYVCATELGGAFRRKAVNKTNVLPMQSITDYQRKIVFLIIAVGMAVCLLFFATSGVNVFLKSVQSLLSGSSANYTETRLNNTNAIGSGYVYQFRVILLPLLVLYLIFFGDKKNKQIGVVLVIPMLIFLLGTGQRGGFVLAMVSLILALCYLNMFYKQGNGKKIILICVGAIALFSMLTVYNGRIIEGQSLFEAVLSRVFDSNQLAATVGFRFIINQPCQWGYDWLMTIMDLLPGKNSYKDISNTIFAILYGSGRGTAPPCIWGSVYYNFNWIGIVVFPVLLALFHEYFYYRLVSRPISGLRIVVYSFAFVSLGSWVAGGIMSMFNQGFITICILIAILGIDRKEPHNI